MDNTTVTKDRKRQDEHTDLRAPVQGSRHDVIVVVKQVRVVLAEPPLSSEAQNKVRQNGRIHPRDQPAQVPQDKGGIDVGPHSVRPEPVRDPEG